MDPTKIAPPRTVGFWGTSLFPLNGMIGAGIFALPAVLVAAVGNFAPWMMLVGGILFLRKDDKFLNSIASRDPRNGTSIMQKIEIPPGIKMRMNV